MRDYIKGSDAVSKKLKSILLNHKPVVLCIGSDRVTGDALGPIVGHLLTDKYDVRAFVYGSLSSPVTALNLNEMIEMIKRRHRGAKIIAIDSGVGDSTDVGVIRIHEGGIYPGSADGKKLPLVGDVSITATVADYNSSPLSSVRLGLVFKLAECIALGVVSAVNESA